MSETIPLTGTGANLIYHSAHHRGRQELFTVFVRPVDMATELGFLSDSDGDATVGASSLRARSEVFVGGQLIGSVEFNNAELLARAVKTVVWNGLDAFGRPVQGVVEAQIRTLYTMTLPFCSNAASSGADAGAIGPRQFGIQSTDLTCTAAGRGVLSVRRDEFVEVGTVNDGLRGLGGWAVGVNHTYAPASSMLFYGNGRRRSVSVTDARASTIRRRVVLDATSSPALSAANWHVRDMDVSPDGTVYFTLGDGEYPDSVYPPTVSPGTGLYRLLPDASSVQIVATETLHPHGVTVHRDGSVWVTDRVHGCVRRYQTTGAPPWTGEVMIGNCSTTARSFVGPYGNGMPAKQNRLDTDDPVSRRFCLERDPLYDLDAPYVSSVRYCRPSTVRVGTQSCASVTAGSDAAAGSGTPGATVVSRERTFVATSTLNETTTVDGLTWAQQTNFGTRTVVYSPPNRQNVTLRFDTQGRLERIEPYAQYPVCISYSGHRVSSVRQGNFATCATTAPPVRRAVSFGYGTGSLRWLEDVTVGHTATTLLTDLTPSANRGLVTSALLPGRTQQSFFEYDADDRLRRVAPAGHYTGTKPPAAASDNGAVRRRTSAVAQGRSSLARSTSCLVVSVGVAPTTLKRLASPTIQTSSV